MPITSKRQPPEFLFKDYHDATVGSEDNQSPPSTAGIQTTPISGRKTRNSNGSRGGSLRPGLRSAKPSFLKSDTDEDDGKNAIETGQFVVHVCMNGCVCMCISECAHARVLGLTNQPQYSMLSLIFSPLSLLHVCRWRWFC